MRRTEVVETFSGNRILGPKHLTLHFEDETLRTCDDVGVLDPQTDLLEIFFVFVVENRVSCWEIGQKKQREKERVTNQCHQRAEHHVVPKSWGSGQTRR